MSFDRAQMTAQAATLASHGVFAGIGRLLNVVPLPSQIVVLEDPTISD